MFLFRGTTAVLSGASSRVCLGVGVAGFTGYVLPQATGTTSASLIAAVAGFVVSVVEARKPLTTKYTNEQISNTRR
jgi:hypothetical protein